MVEAEILFFILKAIAYQSDSNSAPASPQHQATSAATCLGAIAGVYSPIILGVGFTAVPRIRSDGCARLPMPWCAEVVERDMRFFRWPWTAANACRYQTVRPLHPPCSSPVGKAKSCLHARAPTVLIGTPPQSMWWSQ